MDLYQVCSNGGPGVRNGPVAGGGGGGGGVLVSKMKYTSKSSSPELLGSGACLVILYQVCSNQGPRVQDGPAPGGPRFKP